MSSLPLSLLFTFLSTLLLRPYPSGPRGHFGTSAFAFPSALTVLPQQAFASAQTPRSWDVARATQYLMAAWLVVAGGQAISRTVKRVRGGRASAGGGGAGATSGKEGKEVAGGVGIKEADSAVSQATGANKIVKQSSRVAGDICPRPILIALLLHAISWRLAVTLILPDLPGAWKWPFDTTTILGLATGLACSWSEVWRVMRLLGIAGDTYRLTTLVRLTHLLLSSHRLLLAIRIISATLDRSPKPNSNEAFGGMEGMQGMGAPMPGMML